jgi:hypothetical protein
MLAEFTCLQEVFSAALEKLSPPESGPKPQLTPLGSGVGKTQRALDLDPALGGPPHVQQAGEDKATVAGSAQEDREAPAKAPKVAIDDELEAKSPAASEAIIDPRMQALEDLLLKPAEETSTETRSILGAPAAAAKLLTTIPKKPTMARKTRSKTKPPSAHLQQRGAIVPPSPALFSAEVLGFEMVFFLSSTNPAHPITCAPGSCTHCLVSVLLKTAEGVCAKTLSYGKHGLCFDLFEVESSFAGLETPRFCATLEQPTNGIPL